MTVENTKPVAVLAYTGPGRYDFDFLVYEDTDIMVSYIATNGIAEILVNNIDYTVVKNELPNTGGYVETTSPEASSGSLSIKRAVPHTQPTEWTAEGYLKLDKLEESFDRIVMIIQQIAEVIDAGMASFTWRYVWETGIEYSARDMVQGADGNWYYCTLDHSSGVFATDLASGFWALLINRADLVGLVDDAEDAQTAAEAAQAAAEAAQTAAEAAAENIVAAWEDSPTSYDFPDLVAGTNGYTYRCVGADVVGVDPITDDGTNWINISAGLSIVGATPISENSTALSGYLHILTASCVLTLPASPSTPSLIAVANLSGTTTCSIARNGHKINGLAEDMTLDILNASFQLYYTGSTYGWVIL